MSKSKSFPSLTAIQLNFDEVKGYSDQNVINLAIFTLGQLRKKPYRGTLRCNAYQVLRQENYVGVRFLSGEDEVLRIGFQAPPDFSQ